MDIPHNSILAVAILGFFGARSYCIWMKEWIANIRTNLTCDWTAWGSWRAQRGPMQTQGEMQTMHRTASAISKPSFSQLIY